METAIRCWCGNTELTPFSSDYLHCGRCESLVSTHIHAKDVARVDDDEQDFYGRSYWFAHQEEGLHAPNIIDRARGDLSERCAHWVRVLLNYIAPPARSLEIGSGHGGLVLMLQKLGFDASGLELSPWIVDFSRETFGIPVRQGRVEDQDIEPGSLDLIILIDVVEHLTDPVSTLRHCLDLLKPAGLLFIQTPCYPAGTTYDKLVAQESLFLKMLQPDEHLHLLSQQAITQLLAGLDVPHVSFEQALASHDMMLLASRQPLVNSDEASIAPALTSSPDARLVGAILDAQQRAAQIAMYISGKEQDRAALQEYLTVREQAFERQLASLKESIEAKDRYAANLQAAAEKKDAYAQSLQQVVTRKDAELSVLGAHLGEKEVAFQRYAASLHQQIADQKRSYESLRAYVVEREQRIAELDELLRRRAGPLGIVTERAAYQVKRTYPKVRLQVYRVGRRARDVVRRLRRS